MKMKLRSKSVVLSLLMFILAMCSASTVVFAADPSYTVKTGTVSDSTAENGKRSLARTSDGTLHCVYHRSNGTTQLVYYAYSKDQGATWTEEQVSYPPSKTNTQFFPSIAVDSKGNVHVVWNGFGWGTNTGKNNIEYRMRTSSGWQTQEAVTDKTDSQVHPSIAVDSQDNVHVVWYGTRWGTNPLTANIEYRMRTSSGWQPPESVTDIAAIQKLLSIAIDSKDNVHVVWHGLGWGTNTGFNNIEYRMRTSSGWQPQEAVTDKNRNQFSPSVAVDSEDNVHVVWYGLGWGTNTGNYNIEYRMRTSSGWQAQEAVTDKNYDQVAPSVAVDSEDNVHVVWYGFGWGTNTFSFNIEYRMRTSSGWQPEVALTDLAFLQEYPVLIWAEWPDPPNVPQTGYALVYSGQDANGDKVVYLASSDLTWGVEPQLAVGGTVEPASITTILVSYLPIAVLVTAVAAAYASRRRTRK